jgi:alpha-galactosidase
MKRTPEGLMNEFRKMMISPESMKLKPSVEYCRLILRGLATDHPERVFGSFLNRGYVTNLPPECAVEVPVFVDRNGFHPVSVGALPLGVAARTAALAYHQALAAEGILRSDLGLLRQAILVDPNASAQLSTPQLRAMIEELVVANKAYLDGYR